MRVGVYFPGFARCANTLQYFVYGTISPVCTVKSKPNNRLRNNSQISIIRVGQSRLFTVWMQSSSPTLRSMQSAQTTGQSNPIFS